MAVCPQLCQYIAWLIASCSVSTWRGCLPAALSVHCIAVCFLLCQHIAWLFASCSDSTLCGCLPTALLVHCLAVCLLLSVHCMAVCLLPFSVHTSDCCLPFALSVHCMAVCLLLCQFILWLFAYCLVNKHGFVATFNPLHLMNASVALIYGVASRIPVSQPVLAIPEVDSAGPFRAR